MSVSTGALKASWPDSHAPEGSLDGCRQRHARVRRLRRGETDEFRAGCTDEREHCPKMVKRGRTERKGCRHEHGTDALEAVRECTGIPPVLPANVAAVRSAAASDIENWFKVRQNGGSGEERCKRMMGACASRSSAAALRFDSFTRAHLCR